MTITKRISVITLATLAVVVFAVAAPRAEALAAPTCVLNTIVQPANHGGTTLSWKATNAHTITLSGVGIVNAADALVVYPNVATTYTLTATGTGGTVTCAATAQPASSYSFDTYGVWNAAVDAYTCNMWVNPDLVVAGGTAILSWDAGSANAAFVDNGIGNVSTRDSRIIPNNGFSQTYTLTAQWGNGITKHCSATMYPVGAYTGVVAPAYTTGYGVYGAPTITAQYVALNQVPYTGTNDVLYVLGLLAVMLAVVTTIYAQRGTFSNALRVLK